MKKTVFDPKSPLMTILALCIPASGILSLVSTVGFIELGAGSKDRKKKHLLTFAGLLCAAIALIPGVPAEDWLLTALFLLLIPVAFLLMQPAGRKEKLGFWLYAGLCAVLAVLCIIRGVISSDLIHITAEQLGVYAALGTTVFRLDLGRCVAGLVLLLSRKS